jgi:hypothetical protein
MTAMLSKDTFDIARALADAVAPALAAVFKPGEVESVRIAWEGPVSLPDGSESKPTELNVHLVCVGEHHQSNIWSVGGGNYDAAELVDKLIEEFSDFVAESKWGWGQQRP